MRIVAEDVKFHLSGALRAVGVGLAAVAWASVLGSEAQQNADIRAYAQVATAILAVCITQWFGAPPPSATLVDLLRPFERDIIAVAREHAGGDLDRLKMLVRRIAALAAARIQQGADVPRDRRAWLRALANLAVLD